MSGYGGQPPAGNDPYGQGSSGEGWHDPYGGGSSYGGGTPYGQDTQPGWDAQGQYGPPPPHSYGPPGVPQGRGTPGSTIAALVCTSVAVAFCCNVLAIPGIVTAAIATSRASTDPQSARNLTTWSWVILGVALALQVILILVAVVLDINTSGYNSDGI